MSNLEKLPTLMYSIEAEMSVLGSAMLSKKALREIIAKVEESDFYRPGHRIIFRAMSELWALGNPVDQIVMEAHLGAENLQNCGGPDYLLELAMFVPSPSHAGYYADVVKEKSNLRLVVKACEEAIEKAKGGEPSEDIRTSLEKHSRKMVSNLIEARHLSEINAEGDDVGIPSGYPEIDKCIATRGFPTGQMSMIFAGEKAGKSTYMLGSAIGSVKAGRRVCYATFADLNEARLKRRILRYLSGYGTEKSAFEHGELDRFRKAEDMILDPEEWPFFIRDASRSASLRDVDGFLNWLEIKQDRESSAFGIVYVDYAQKLTAKGAPSSKQVELGDYCSDRISACAERTGIPIVVGSQVTQGNPREGREAMTKGSRKWLEDCGLALLIEKDKGDAATTEIFRSRFGGMGVTKPIKLNSHYLRFDEVNVP